MACTSSQLLFLPTLRSDAFALLVSVARAATHTSTSPLTGCEWAHSYASVSLHPADLAVWSWPPGAVMAFAEEDYMRQQLRDLKGEIAAL